MQRVIRHLLWMTMLVGMGLLAACAHRAPAPAVVLPALKLSPASLGRSFAAQQRLHFEFGRQQRDLDAMLEVDASQVRLAVQAMGQSGVRLQWDGHTLSEQRAPWLPQAVRSARVLDDLQFALWPAEAIRAALPPDWQLRDDGSTRALARGGQDWLLLTRESPQRLHLDNRAEGYRLTIESMEEAP